MKRLFSMLMICLLILQFPVMAENPISATLNGSPIIFDQPPIIINDRTMVPVRAVCEALGADVYWEPASRAVVIVKNNTKVFLAIDNNNMLVGPIPDFATLMASLNDGTYLETVRNSKLILLDSAPTIVGDRTLLPIRAVCEAFGAEVEWNSESRAVLITCPEDILKDTNRDKAFMESIRSYGAFLSPTLLHGFLMDKSLKNTGTYTVSGLKGTDNKNDIASFIAACLKEEFTELRSFDIAGNEICVTFAYADTFYPETFTDILYRKVPMEFRDANGKTILADRHISGATMETTENGYQVSLALTEEGTRIFADATEKIAASEKNTVTLYARNTPIYTAQVAAPINTSTVNMFVSDLAEAQQLTALLKGTHLPDYAEVSFHK